MVFNRSKYLRGREGPQKEGGGGLERILAGGEDGVGCSLTKLHLYSSFVATELNHCSGPQPRECHFKYLLFAFILELVARG